MKWNEYPFLRLTIGVIIGILINSSIKCIDYSCYYVLLLSALFFCFYLIVSWKHSTKFGKKYLGILGISSFILLGYLTAQLNYLMEKPQFSHEVLKASDYYSVTIISNPIKTSKTTKYEAVIDRLKVDDTWMHVSEKAVIYLISKDSTAYTYGDNLLVKGNPEFFRHQTNPYAFDYSKYMGRRGFYLQDFVYDNQILWVRNSPKYSIKYFSLLAGNFFQQMLSHYITEDRELNMIRAMVLGRRDEITSEMEYVYQSTGTSHILAVSGLHVGILFLIFSTLLKSMKKRWFKWVYYGIILFIIWSFAFITGGSPSVFRASLMITIILIAEILSRKCNIYNSILVSAFFLLLFNPNLLFSVSFQLSYVAVFGIVYLYSKIYRMVYIKYRLLNFFWKITALSISAQVATFPITIYYFHQFPSLFLFTNLLAIPTAMVTIPGSFLILLMHPFGFMAELISTVLEGWVFYYNEIMSEISSYSFASISGLYMETYFVFLIFACLFFLIRFMEIRKLYLFRLFTITLICSAAITLYNKINLYNQEKIVFYDTQNRSYVDLFIGSNCYTNIEPINVTDANVHFNITPNRMHHKISAIKSFTESKNVASIGRNNLIVHNNVSILFLEELNTPLGQYEKPKIDYLVLNKNSLKYLPNISGLLEYREVIFDATINAEQATSFKKIHKKPSKIHSISLDGAYVISI